MAIMANEHPIALDSSNCVGKGDADCIGIQKIIVGGYKEIRLSSNIVEAANAECMTAFHSTERCLEWIDFSYNDDSPITFMHFNYE